MRLRRGLFLDPRSVIRRAADRMRHLPAALRGNGTPCSRAQRSAAGCVRSVSGRCKALVSPTVKTKNEKRPAALTEHRQSSRTLDFPALQIKPFPDVYSPGTARMPETAIRPLHFIPRPTQVPLRPKEAFRRVPKQAELLRPAAADPARPVFSAAMHPRTAARRCAA